MHLDPGQDQEITHLRPRSWVDTSNGPCGKDRGDLNAKRQGVAEGSRNKQRNNQNVSIYRITLICFLCRFLQSASRHNNYPVSLYPYICWASVLATDEDEKCEASNGNSGTRSTKRCCLPSLPPSPCSSSPFSDAACGRGKSFGSRDLRRRREGGRCEGKKGEGKAVS